jgi:3-deoxy-D-manno-octulosonate 8-phosphate phosphatase (KDO 8-P phosphatase)
MLPTLRERCARIELLVLDVDGVLTEGGIVYSEDEKEIKGFHVRDGSGLAIWKHVGKKSAIITGRTSRIVEVRAAELEISPVFQGTTQKLEPFLKSLDATRLTAEQACFIGDDFPDLAVMRKCGLAVAVADACPDVLGEAHYVTRCPGGRGAVRETIELILNCQGHWQKVIHRFRGEDDDPAS